MQDDLNREFSQMATVLNFNNLRCIAAPDLKTDMDLSTEEIQSLLKISLDIKREPHKYSRSLSGRSVVLLFEKPSLRTRLTFELAVRQMGGNSIFSEGRIGAREPLQDVARNMEGWVNAIVARTFDQSTIDRLAEYASIPVINALSDLYHPCQALADMFSLQEYFRRLRGIRLAFVGDGNNVAHSLMLCAARLGVNFALATPAGYKPDPGIVEIAQECASASGAEIKVTEDPVEAVTDADAVYTDVWASMGQEDEAVERRRYFVPYQVNAALMRRAKPKAAFMHCLPAKRGQEVTDDVMESRQSIVFAQAENRLYVEQALLMMMIGDQADSRHEENERPR
jgi:ornithine carbamoyltransferase